jgi:beta-glucosidase
MRYQGAGSSRINPTRIVNPADVLTKCVGVEKADVAIVFVGLPPLYESEGYDRNNMLMPPEHIKLIEDTSAKNHNTVVVLFCGSPVEAPWADKVKASLFMGLPGQAGGEAVKNLLYGKANPSGKLAESWPMKYTDCPSHSYYHSRDGQYREGIYVGYRYYDKAQVKPRWNFGFGLSYTKFEYSEASIDGETVHVTVTNTGKFAGAEIIQLYIAPPQDGIHRPIRELKRFKKAYLKPGESFRASFMLDDRCFSIWHDGWKIPSGRYCVLVGGNPDKLLTVGSIEKSGDVIQIPSWQANSWYEKPKGSPTQSEWESMLGRNYSAYKPVKGKFTLNDSVADMKEYSFVMKIMYLAIKRTISKRIRPDMPEYKMFLEASAGSAMRCLQISGGQKPSLLNGLLAMANGKFIQGLGIILKGSR